MPTSNPRKLFKRYQAALISEVGNKGLDDKTINTIGKREFGAAWAGCHPQDRAKFKPNTYQVINTDTHDKPGVHWLGVYITKTRAYVFDSFGRSISHLVHLLTDSLKEHGFLLGTTDLARHPEQRGFTSEVCGQDSLSILLVVRDLGITKARTL
jgi:hypothetical protein